MPPQWIHAGQNRKVPPYHARASRQTPRCQVPNTAACEGICERGRDVNAPLDLSRLAMVKHRGGKLVAQCPACAAQGADRSGEHFVAFDDGRGPFGCVAHAGNVQHRREIAAALGTRDDYKLAPLPIRAPRPTPSRKLQLPETRRPTLRELFDIADQRGLPFIAGLERAARAGMLRCATMFDDGEIVTAWLLVDSAGISAQARRLDGKPWQGIGGVKAKTLPGSQAAWPIGAADIGSRPFVALAEGSTDTLAAWSLAWWEGKSMEIAPVCMTGAGMRIHPDALEFFKGKGIYTFPHRDDAGERAQANWSAELMLAGAAWVKPFDVAPHNDLNEWLTAAALGEDDA